MGVLMKYYNLFFLLISINITEYIYSEIFSDFHIKNNTDSQVIIITYCDICTLSQGTELIIPKNGEGVIEGTCRFFGCEKFVGWSQNASLLIQIGLQKIGPLKASAVLSDYEPVGYIKKFNDKFFLELENPYRIVPSHE